MKKLLDFINEFEDKVYSEFKNEYDVEYIKECFEENNGIISDVYDVWNAFDNDYDVQNDVRSIAWEIASGLLIKDEELCLEYIKNVYDDDPELVENTYKSYGYVYDGNVNDKIKDIAEEILYEFDFGEVIDNGNDLQTRAKEIFVDVIMNE